MLQILVEFCRSGAIGPIHVAQSATVVFDTLGSPSNIAEIGKGQNKRTILKYDALEVTLCNEHVETIMLSNQSVEGHNWKIGGAIASLYSIQRIDEEKMLASLDEACIRRELDSDLTLGDQRTWIVGPGVRLIMDASTKELCKAIFGNGLATQHTNQNPRRMA